MKEIDAAKCKVHVLVCTNERAPERSCCKKVGGQELYLKLKQKLTETGIRGTHWVTRTGCLGYCNDLGPTVVINRPGRSSHWFSEVVDSDFDSIWEEIVRE